MLARLLAHRASSLGLFAMLAACSSGAAPTEPTTPPPSPAPLPPESAAPVVTASATVQPAPREPAFVAVAKLEGPHTLFPIDDGILVAAQEAKPWEGDEGIGNRIGFLEGDTPKFTKELFLPGWYHNIVGASGSQASEVTLLAVGDTGRAPMAERYRIQQGALKAVPDCRVDGCNTSQRYVGLAKSKDSLLGLNAPLYPFSAVPFFTTFKGPPVKLSLAAAPPACKRDGETPKVHLWIPTAIGALPDGTVMVYGSTCDDKVAIETWKEGAGSSTVSLVDSDEARGGQFVLSKTGDAWLLDTHLFHLEAGTWKRIETPGPGDEPVRGAITGDGTLYLATATGLYKRAKDRWEAEELPNDAKPEDVAADKDGVLWVVGGGALMRQKKVADSGGSVATVEVKAYHPPAPKRTLTAGGPQCKSNVVVLYGFTKVTPEDYDFPLTRKALKGHREFKDVKFLVTKDMGKKFFVAKTPNYALAKSLVKVIEQGVQGSKPGVICAEPEVVRELKLDLATGNIAK